MRKGILVSALIFLALIFLSCGRGSNAPTEGVWYRVEQFDIVSLPYDSLSFTGFPESSAYRAYPVDDDSVYMDDSHGEVCYHPVFLAQTGLILLDIYHSTGNEYYLNWARKHANKLQEIARYFYGVPFYPYPFNFPLHGDTTQTMYAPWYSGLAQGEALQLFVRLYNETGDRRYLMVADEIFASFSIFRGQSDVWVVAVDSLEYFWIEEYPMEELNHTLNGFIYAVYGIYEYYLLTGNNDARNILLASFTTLKQYIPDFRCPGGYSYYCLKHRAQSRKYHLVHIDQLHKLYLMTGDEFFEEMSQLFWEDYHE